MGSDGSHGPKPWRQTKMSTRFLRVPQADWPLVKRGLKREFRAASGAVTQAHNLPAPTPVFAYTVNKRGQYDGRMMVLEAVWQEALGAITPESLRNEGFATLGEFRRYWMDRERRRFTPLRRVFAFRVRPWEPGDDEHCGRILLDQLYGELLDEQRG